MNRKARLSRKHRDGLLRALFKFVVEWDARGISERMAGYMRDDTAGKITESSGLGLVLVRYTLPHLDPKQASKWGAVLDYARHGGIQLEALAKFLKAEGGIEGCQREWTRVRFANSDE